MQAQLLECAKEIAEQDYPQPWNSLLPEMLLNVRSKDVSRIMGGLLMMRTVARRLRHVREPGARLSRVVEEFSGAALPVLLTLLQGLLLEQSTADELATMMKTILKILWSCMYIDVPEALADSSEGWLNPSGRPCA